MLIGQVKTLLKPYVSHVWGLAPYAIYHEIYTVKFKENFMVSAKFKFSNLSWLPKVVFVNRVIRRVFRD